MSGPQPPVYPPQPPQPPIIGKDLPFKQPDFNKPIDELEQITEPSKLVLFKCYAIKNRTSNDIYNESKDFIGQYLGRVDNETIWILLYERGDTEDSKWKKFENTIFIKVFSMDIDYITTKLRDGLNEEQKLKLEEAIKHFKLTDVFGFANLVMINNGNDIFAKTKTPNRIHMYGEISIYELGYGGDMISATVSPENATSQLNAARFMAMPISKKHLSSKMLNRIGEIKTGREYSTKTEFPVLPNVLSSKVNSYLAADHPPPQTPKRR